MLGVVFEALPQSLLHLAQALLHFLRVQSEVLMNIGGDAVEASIAFRVDLLHVEECNVLLALNLLGVLRQHDTVSFGPIVDVLLGNISQLVLRYFPFAAVAKGINLVLFLLQLSFILGVAGLIFLMLLHELLHPRHVILNVLEERIHMLVNKIRVLGHAVGCLHHHIVQVERNLCESIDRQKGPFFRDQHCQIV